MAQQPLYLLTAVDLRRTSRPGISRANTAASLVIPALKFMTANHNPGGGVGEVEFTLPRIEALEPKFDGKGLDADLFSGMGRVDKWTFAGAYRDKKTNRAIKARGFIEGAIAEWEPDESDPSDFQGCSHMFKEVTHFEFILDDRELIYFDFYERLLRVDGVDEFAADRQALGA